ncbi:murein biosynthesis integral membrane protein MurJ, partial [Neobacillus sp. MM2021_6]|nr:murein biosynthesis integral membrane protein MurJ [Neobacillus sp. MM2021_6]
MSNTIKTISVIVIISIFAKLSGLFREVSIATQYGISGATDAYFIASTLPVVIFSLISFSINSSVIP